LAAVLLPAPPAAREVLRALQGKNVALVFAGGNIDPLILSRVIEKGLVADGRRGRFTAVISDRPGGLARLTQSIAEAGASITDISHERSFSGPDVSKVHATCTVETRDLAHLRSVLRRLSRDGIQVVSA
jgi:threonine dehydratase